MDYSFLSLYRLKTRSQFLNVLRNGKKRSIGVVAIYFIPNNLCYPRLGVIVAKRNVKKATSRNTIKRIVRESFRLHKHTLQSVDIVIRAFKMSDDIDKSELRKCIEKLLPQLA